jgi:hypothetical protein
MISYSRYAGHVRWWQEGSPESTVKFNNLCIFIQKWIAYAYAPFLRAHIHVTVDPVSKDEPAIFFTINIYTKYKAAVLYSLYCGWRLPNTISPSKYRDTPVIVSTGLSMGPYSRVTQRINCEPLFLHKLKSRLVNHINYYVPNRLSDEMYEGDRTASIATHLRKKYSERNIDNLWNMFVAKYSHLLE